MTRGWRSATTGLLVGIAAAWSPAIAVAGDITVTAAGNVDDVTVNGNCTLREAIQAANDNATVDACPDPGPPGSADQVILGSDEYVIGIAPDASPDDNQDGDFDVDTDATSGNLTIQGVNRLSTEIDAQLMDRALHLFGGGTVTVEGLAVLNGLRSDSAIADRGGGIFAQGAALTLVGCNVVFNETAAEGGGIAVTIPASMTFSDSFIIDNAAHGTLGGGGLFWQPGSAVPTLTLEGTSVLDNHATTPILGMNMSGGGISSFGNLTMNSGQLNDNDVSVTTGTARGGGLSHNGSGGTATFNQSTIAGNSATNTANTGAANGGGIFFQNPSLASAAVVLNASTLSDNYVDSPMGGLQQGGGVYGLNPSRMRLVNSTVSGNLAPDSGGDGGGIHDNGVVLDVAHATFADNVAADLGDAVNLSATGTDTLRNSILAEGPDACDTATFTSAGGNVDAATSCWGASMPTDAQNSPAQLGPLAENGNPASFTHALALNSPARDRVPVADCDDDMGVPLMQDQRAVARPFPAGGLCDSGSYELIVCNGAPFTPTGVFTGCPPPPAQPTTPAATPPVQAPAKKKRCKKKRKKRAGGAAKRCKKKKKR